MRVLELKIPPVAIVLVTASLMWFSSWAVPAVDLVVPARDLVSLGLAIAGAATSSLGVVSFRRAGTTVNPLTPERVIDAGALRHLHTHSQPDVSRISYAVARVGNLRVERCFIALHSCFRRLHESLPN